MKLNCRHSAKSQSNWFIRKFEFLENCLVNGVDKFILNEKIKDFRGILLISQIISSLLNNITCSFKLIRKYFYRKSNESYKMLIISHLENKTELFGKSGFYAFLLFGFMFLGTSNMWAAEVVLGSNAQGVANVNAGTTGVLIHSFTLDGNASGGNVTGLTFPTTGTYAASEIVNFKLYCTSTTATFTSPTLLATISSPSVAGTQTFPAFASDSGNEIWYYWITMDVSSSVVNGHHLTVCLM